MSLNGTSGIIRFGNLTPETRPIVILRPNPRKVSEADPDEVPVTLAMYVSGKRCMVSIAAAFAAARRAWLEAIVVRDDDGAPTFHAGADGTPDLDNPRYQDDPAMWGVFLASALQVVVPGLLESEAYVLANDEPVARGLLESGGWLRKREAVPEDDDRPEVAGGEPSSTGEGSPPDSASTTPALTGDSA